MAAKYEIKRSKNKAFHFNLKAPNGEIVLTSETYKTRGGAKNGIASVRRHGPNCLQYDIKMDKRKQYYFLLKSSNHKVIGRSESYTRAASMEKGIQIVMKHSSTSKVDDLTE